MKPESKRASRMMTGLGFGLLTEGPEGRRLHKRRRSKVNRRVAKAALAGEEAKP